MLPQLNVKKQPPDQVVWISVADRRLEQAGSRIHEFGVFLQRGKTHRRASFIHGPRIVNRARLPPVVKDMKLGSVFLEPALVDENAIGEISDVTQVDLAAGFVGFHQIQTFSLKGEVVIGMLDQEPGGPGPIQADHLPGRPTEVVDDSCQSFGIAAVDFFKIQRG